MKQVPFKRVIAVLLCFAVLLPNLTGLAAAADTDTGSSQTGQQTEQENAWVPVVPTDIPAYDTAGVASEELICDCGNGLSQDNAKSYFRMVTGTNLTEFEAYLAKLADNGFTKTAENRIAGNAAGTENISTRWLSPNQDYVLTVYFTPDYSEVKIVADTGEDIVKSYAAGFRYAGGEAVTSVMMTMWGLSMAPNGYDTTTTKPEYDTKRRNCGAAIVIRMPDNSLFINDGGDLQQWSDEACADFLEFCRQITGTGEGEKVIINTWFISHAHTDHFEGLPRFIDMYHNEIDIQNVMYSLDDEMLGSTRDMSDVLKMVKAYYPDVKYYKPHTGEHFTINGIEFDVLYTQEDRFLPDADGNLDFGKVSSKLRPNGTYRDFLVESTNATTGAKEYDFNDTSTVLKITFPKSVTGENVDYDTILYADANLADQAMWETLGEDVLATNIMMVPHHGHDAHPELVAMSGANIFLYTQHKQAIYGPDDDYTTADAAGTYRPNLRNLFLEMQEQDADNDGNPDLYFNTTATHKTYWEGNETAVIFFGEDKSFAEASTLGMALDGESPDGFTVYTKAAPDFAYGGWTLLSNVVGTDVKTVSGVPTNDHTIRADAVEVDSDSTENNILTSGKHYIIVHDKTDQVMSYQTTVGTVDPPRPSSLLASTGPNAKAGLAELYFKYESSTGTSDDKSIYFTQYLRDQIMWEFTLDDLTDKWENSDEINHNTSTPAFGGDAAEYFFRSYWRKGLSSEEAYWYTDPANADTAWRYLAPNNSAVVTNFTTSLTFNTRVEFFKNNGKTDVDGDGTIETCDTCVIYYCKEADNGTKSDFRFLTVDADGNWIQKKYDTISEAKADLANLKLRLYEYYVTSDTQSVGCVGPQTYYATVDTEEAELTDAIAYQLTVQDTSRRTRVIPCSGQTPKVGYYWLDGDFSTASVRQSTITVKYRNDDGTDTEITTLTLYVVDELVTDAYLTAEGMAAANSSLAGNVYESRDDEGLVTDRTMTVVASTAEGYIRKEVSVNVGMLSYDADSTVTAPEGTAVSAGTAGALVDTAVEAGTVYNGLTLSYNGMVISEDFTLSIEDISETDQPDYPNPGSVQVNKTGVAAGESFFQTGIANVQLSATGISKTTGVDLIMVLDMSGSMSDAVKEGDDTVRLDALKSSMKTLMATLQNSKVNFRVAISDFGDLDHFMFEDAVADSSIRDKAFFDTNNGTDWNDNANSAYGSSYEVYNHLNYIFSHYGEDIYKYTKDDGTVQEWSVNQFNAYIDGLDAGVDGAAEKARWTKGELLVDMDNQAEPFERTITKWCNVHNRYTGSLEPNVYTGSLQPNAGAFVDVDSKSSTEWEALIDGFKQGFGYWYGTNYDRGLEYMYQLGYSIQQDNIDKGLDREVVAVFISDGAPMQYNYFSGRTTTPSWADWFSGRIDASKLQTTPYTAANKPQSLLTLETTMLEALKTENKLVNVDFAIIAASNAKELQTNAGVTIINENNDYVFPVSTAGDFTTQINANKIAGNQSYFYLQYVEGTTSFYDVMLDNGIRMDEDMMNRIAAANGIDCDAENMTKAEIAAVDAQLLALAQDGVGGKVKYPTTTARYLYDADATDLYASLKALLGYDVTLDKLLQIAYRSNNVTINEETINLRSLMVAAMAEATTLGDGYEWGTLSPYSYFYNEEGKNWWAEAIKGDTDKLYPVINKYAEVDHADGTFNYYGTVRNHYDSGTGAAYDGKDYIAGYRGLGIPIYTLGVSIGGIGYISNEDTVNVLKNISSGESYAFSAYSGEDLNKIFATITASATNAATKAWYTDTMGDAYDLLTTTTNGVTPVIEVREYALDENHNRIQKKDENGQLVVDANNIPVYEYNVLEQIKFDYTDENGVTYKAVSSAVFKSEITGEDQEVPTLTPIDIWGDDGVIRGRYIYYNTNQDPDPKDDNVVGAVKIDLTGDDVLDYTLAPETFLWIVGTIGITEQVLDYQVYLSGSDDEDPAEVPPAGDYPTNKSAPLYYVNYRGKSVSLEPESPVFPWGKARMGYGFYLVNDEGKPIVNMITEATGTIEQAVKLTSPVYQNLPLDEQLTDNKISSAENASGVPSGYSLYVANVSYFAAAASDGTGKWNFQSDATGTTYVQYGSTYTNTTLSDGLNLTNGEIHDTIVWFAVRATEGELSVDKTVEKDGENYTLTLEAFATGATSQISEIKPADIVLVLDQSASMYTPAGLAADRLYADKEHSDNVPIPDSAKIENFSSKVASGDETILNNAKHLGYYIAVHKTLDYVYVVQYAEYAEGQWGWFYVPVDVTTRSVKVDTANATADGAKALFGDNADANVDTNDSPIYFIRDTNDLDNDNNTTEYIENPALLDSFGTYAQVDYNYAILPDSLVTYYQSQYGALYDSVSDFVSNLNAQAMANEVDHRVAIVGFSSPYYDAMNNYNGTGIYINGSYYLYDTDYKYKGEEVNGELVQDNENGTVILDPDEGFKEWPFKPVAADKSEYSYAGIVEGNVNRYASAFVDISTEAGLKNVEASINAISTNYMQTCPAIGIRIARSIFKGEQIPLIDPGLANTSTTAETLINAAQPDKTVSTDRDQIIILFTDGVPTVSMYSDHDDAISENAEIRNEYWTGNAGVRDAINEANAAKTEGVKIYTIGTAAASKKYGNLGDATYTASSDNRVPFLDLVSSNYPSSSSVYDIVTSTNDNTTISEYRFIINYGDKAEGADYAVSAAGGNELTVAFNSIMRSVTTPSVDLNEFDILREVLSDYFDLIGGENAVIEVYTAAMNADGSFANPEPLEGAVVTFGKTDSNSERYDVVNVSGYNYSEEYCSKKARTRDGKDYYGSKLIVKVPVKVRDGFWGGNNVPTNEDTTAIYDVTDKEETVVIVFPMPQVNVPYANIEINDVTVYYGDSTVDHDDLMGSVTVNGKSVTINADGTFTPADSWMADYATIEWGDNSAILNTAVSSTAPDAYTYSVVFTPTDDGLQKYGNYYSNIVGAAIDTDGVTLSGEGNVYVLVPTVTFRDGFIDSFTTPDRAFFETNNKVAGVEWTQMVLAGDTAAENIPAVTGTEPTLTYTYTPESTGYKEDTKVNVTVSSSNGNADITNVTTFDWQTRSACAHEAIESHAGSVATHEFVIHVLTCKDAVVIDFGLSVDINVLSNDTFQASGNPTLVGVYQDRPATMPNTFATSAGNTVGTIKNQTASALRYTLNDGNSMQMNDMETYYYVIQYTIDGVTGYYYGQVDIIPATIIYYEDNFVEFSVAGTDTTSGWTDAYTDATVTDFSGVVQSDDRVGTGNRYGYDDAYTSMSMYSLGAAKKITVNPDRTGRAEFSFWGTGFDVISLTSSDTGTLLVRIFQLGENGELVDSYTSDADIDPFKSYFVDTYYGYTYNTSTKKWEVNGEASDTLYQVPVIKAEGLPYGNYKAVISVSYSTLFDHKGSDAVNGSYDFYLDAIRIYNPAGDANDANNQPPEDIKTAYKQDGEFKPIFEELRELLITADDFNTAADTVEGIVFIDGVDENASVSDYINCGPNNELYLDTQQAVAFVLNKQSAKDVHLAMKSVGGTAKVKIYAASENVDVATLPVIEVSTATDLYYGIKDLKNGSTVVIYNCGGDGDAILSVTNIKSTYDETGTGGGSSDNQNQKENEGIFIDPASAAIALSSLTPEAAAVPVLTPVYPTLDFAEEVHYNVYFTVDNGDALELADMGLLTWYTKPETVSYETAEYVTPGAYYNEGSGNYVVHSQGIPAMKLADKLYMVVYAQLDDGSYVYSDLCCYHAKAYAQDRLVNSTSDKMKALCVSMLNYGAAAQTFFGYNTDALMNADLTAEQLALVDSYDASMIAPVVSPDSSKTGVFTASAGAFSEAYPSVSFEGAFAINYYFVRANVPDDGMTFYYWDMETYNSVSQLTVENATGVKTMTEDSGRYWASYTDIAAKQIDETVFVCGVYESNGVRYCTGVIAYSLGAYCLDRIQNGSAAMQSFAKATAVYGAYAKNYFGIV